VIREAKEVLLQKWHPSCYSCKHSSDKSWTRNGQYLTRTNGTYWLPLCNCWPSHDGDCKTVEELTWPPATLYQGNHARKHMINWNIPPYAGAAGMLLHIKDKFSLGKFKSCKGLFSTCPNCQFLSVGLLRELISLRSAWGGDKRKKNLYKRKKIHWNWKTDIS